MVEEYRRNGWWRDRTLLDDFLDASAERPDGPRWSPTTRSARPRRSPTASSRRSSTASPAACSTSASSRATWSRCSCPTAGSSPALSLACARVGAVVNPLVPIFRHRELRFILGRTEAQVLRGARPRSGASTTASCSASWPASCPRCTTPSWSARRRTGGAIDFRAAASRSTSSTPLGGRGPGLPAELAGAGPRPTTWPRSSSPRARPASPRACSTRPTRSGRRPGRSPRCSGLGARRRRASWPRRWPTRPASSTGCCCRWLGMKVVYQDMWDAGRVGASIVDDEGVTWTVGATPFVMDTLAAQREARAGGLPRHLRWFSAAARPSRPRLVAAAREVLGAQLVAVWGMTENGVVTIHPPGRPAPRWWPTPTASPVDWMEVRVVDEDGAEAGRRVDGPGRPAAGAGGEPGAGLLPAPRPVRGPAPGRRRRRRLVRHRRPGLAAGRRRHPHRRAHQGPGHPGRREHPGGRGRGGALHPPAGGRRWRSSASPTSASASGPARSSW